MPLRRICPLLRASIRSREGSPEKWSVQRFLHVNILSNRVNIEETFKSRADGLFGIPQLRNPRDFIAFMEHTETRSTQLINEILTSKPGVRIVELMDELSDTLCRCYDAAEACRNIHTEKQWRDAATQVCHRLGDVIGEVNQNHGMYSQLIRALKTATDTSSTSSGQSSSASSHPTTTNYNTNTMNMSHSVESSSHVKRDRLSRGWCAESYRVAQQLALDMEKAGIHLPPSARARMQDMMSANNHYAAQFSRSLRDPSQLGSIRLRNRNMVLDAASVNGLLATETNEDLRQKVWMAASRSPAGNVQLLRSMITARHEQACLAGFDSYSSYKAHGMSLADKPEAIVSFLQQLASQVKHKADEEIQGLLRLKQQIQSNQPASSSQTSFSSFWSLRKPKDGEEGDDTSTPTSTKSASYVSSSAATTTGTVQPWDLEFLIATARSQQAKQQGLSVNKLYEYTRLPVVLEGLSQLIERSMGISLTIRSASPSESWAPGVLRCDASHKDTGYMGTVYLDVCSRAGKYPSAVTFPIRLGRQLPDGPYQAPVMALLADYGPQGIRPEDLCLTASDLRVLLHEFGHCMHNLVSRTKYQHLSGTRCAQDLVELPSHLFEHFTTDHRTLGILARHHATGDPLPKAMCDALAQRRTLFAGIELQQQLLLALADQALFGPSAAHMMTAQHAAGATSRSGSVTSRDASSWTSNTWRDATQPFSSVPWVEGSQPELRMSHLTIYGATYYSYIYARCLSGAVWNTLLAKDPLDPGAGEAVVRGLLQSGGAVEPVTLVQEVLGPTVLVRHDSSGGWSPGVTPDLVGAALEAT